MDHTTFFSPSTGRRVKAVLFDTFGTVVDWRSGIATEVQEFATRHRLDADPADMADKWRGGYYPSMAPILAGERDYTPLDQLHMENLRLALQQSGFDPEQFTADELHELNRAWEKLPAWPDSRTGLSILKERYIIGPLSNGNTALLVNMAKNAGLPWDVVVGLDLLKAYKPDPAAYTGVARVLRLEPGEVMLAAAHNYDLKAARDAGLATAFILRSTEHGPNQATDLAAESDWDIAVEDMKQLAAALVEPSQTPSTNMTP